MIAKWLIGTLLVVHSLLSCSTASHAELVRAVMLSGDPVPGRSGDVFGFPWTDFLPLANFAPTINAEGSVAFGGTTEQFGDRSKGVWIEEAGVLRSLAFGKDPAPGTGRNFVSFGRPTLTASGDVAFPSTVGEGGSTLSALMLENADGLNSFAVEGVMFGSQLVQPIFTNVAVHDASNIAFVGRVRVGFPSQDRLFQVEGPATHLLATVSGRPPGLDTPFTLESVNNVQINKHGVIAFQGEVSRSSVSQNVGIFAGDRSNLRPVALRGDALPGLTTGVTLNSAGGFSLSSTGDVAFGASLQGVGTNASNDSALFAQVNGKLELVARAGMVAPGVPGNAKFRFFNSAAPLLNANSQIAFWAPLTGSSVNTSNDAGIWGGDWNDLSLLVREGDLAPGTAAGIVFGNFGVVGGSLTLNSRGQIALLTNLAGEGVTTANDLGIWATDTLGNLQLIVREGDSLEVAPGVIKTVREIAMIGSSNNEEGWASGFSDRGQIAFVATFTDLTYGVFVSNQVAIPEPSSFTMVVLGCAVFGWRRR